MVDADAVVHWIVVAFCAVCVFGFPLWWTLPLARAARGGPAAWVYQAQAAFMMLFFAAMTAFNIWLRAWDFAVVDVGGIGLYAYIWWVAGGGDSMRKFRDRIRSAIRRAGARLIAVPVPG